ncbi:MFS transporter [Shimazuella sp. AN120528]|uniref:MFS transporter n=1 Tax=Shimazuella soli TaxID=1892854 RepID=UPI001F0E7D15|nr:MFS transporter [Shimazuella soli]MCH5585889.1 MFS transporter [Shimazuella soli]
MDKKVVRAWIWYDWANSAFATTMIAAVMPIFFSDVAAKTLAKTTATAYWGYTESISLVLLVLLSPILGSIADRAGRKKQFLRSFTYLGIGSSLLMATIDEGEWRWAVVLVIIGSLAFACSNIFYDALLPEIAEEKDRDMVSSRGYALGYIGGGVLLALQLVFIQKPDWFGLTTVSATQIAFASVGVWWFFFSLPIFKHVKDKENKSAESFFQLCKNSTQQVIRTIGQLPKYPELLRFLIAFWFFNDGINTIIKMATIYGREIGIGTSDLILALLITQFVGLPFTLLFGKFAGWFGSKRTLITTIIIYLFIVILGYGMTTSFHFYVLAVLVGVVQGGSQALSRSIYSQLVPANRNAEFFGFYGLSGKFSAIFGPFVFGLAGQLTGSSRFGILSLAIFFVIGILLLWKLNLEKGRQEAISNISKK